MFNKVKPAHQVKPGEFVETPQFYGTVESTEFPVGTQNVVLHLKCGYTFTVQRNTKVEVK